MQTLLAQQKKRSCISRDYDRLNSSHSVAYLILSAPRLDVNQSDRMHGRWPQLRGD